MKKKLRTVFRSHLSKGLFLLLIFRAKTAPAVHGPVDKGSRLLKSAVDMNIWF